MAALPSRRAVALAVLAGGLALASSLPLSAWQGAAQGQPTLEETRLTLSKWIETQQIISKERNEWQQGREVLQGRLDLVRKEIATLDEKLGQSQAAVAESAKKRDELQKKNDEVKAVGAQLAEAVGAMEAEVRVLFKSLPEPVVAKLKPLYQRMPDEAAKARVSVAERYQNVLGILNELNKAATEIAIAFETRTQPDGRTIEVQTIYVGLAQAYYTSPQGDAGIGRPSPDGWKWTADKSIAGAVLTALEVVQGKQTPQFVPLPVRIQ